MYMRTISAAPRSASLACSDNSSCFSISCSYNKPDYHLGRVNSEHVPLCFVHDTAVIFNAILNVLNVVLRIYQLNEDKM